MYQRVDMPVEVGGEVKSNRLSNSQFNMYGECGVKYQNHYINRLREKTKSGALCFGSAFDKGTEGLLKHFQANKNWDLDEYAMFDSAWSKVDINGRYFDAPMCEFIGYKEADFDYELLTSDDQKFLSAKLEELFPGFYSDLEDAYKVFADYRSKNDNGIRFWQPNELGMHNLFHWLSLRRKGHLMLKANRKYVLPKIKEVLGVQKLIELKNDNGDSVIGYIDLECIWEDGRHVVFDYKTSAREYDEDAVRVSPQLAIYTYATGAPYGGFGVFKKQIKKNRKKVCKSCSFDGTGGRHKTCANEVNGARCGGEWDEKIDPVAEVDIMIDPISARTQEIVVENMNSVNQAINNGVYTRNFRACKNSYGRCPYFNLCYKGTDGDLEKV